MFDWLFSKPLAVGTTAPDFELPDESGNRIRLSSLKRPAILIWYPGDDTRICTQQLCALRDHWSDAQTQGIAVFGINPQGAESHARFRAKHALPFPLLIDRGQQVGARYGTRGLIVKRTVYAIGADGVIKGVWRGNPPAEEVLATLVAK